MHAVNVALAAGDHEIGSQALFFHSDILLGKQDYSRALEKARSAVVENARIATSRYDEPRATLAETRALLALKEPKLAAEAVISAISVAREED